MFMHAEPVSVGLARIQDDGLALGASHGAERRRGLDSYRMREQGNIVGDEVNVLAERLAAENAQIDLVLCTSISIARYSLVHARLVHARLVHARLVHARLVCARLP